MKSSIEQFGMESMLSITDSPISMSYDEKMAVLEKILLELVGEKFCQPKEGEEDIDSLISEGLFYAPEDLVIKKMIGDDHRCHANSAACWAANRDNCLIVTGYALFNDIWMQHIWVMVGDAENGNEPTLVETTVLADEYFGVVLTPEQCRAFFENNWC
ncbi:hypothetical protein QTV49_000486 [Vibrio vulnificus]|nr:hypothetical protein [Vibrio vulnificus]